MDLQNGFERDRFAVSHGFGCKHHGINVCEDVGGADIFGTLAKLSYGVGTKQTARFDLQSLDP